MEELPKNSKVIFRGICGSTAYGLNTPTSDIDYRTVYIQNEYDILSNQYIPQVNITPDHTAYEIRRFIELIENANPNAIELLFLDEEFIEIKTLEWDRLLALRNKFITKKAYNTFAGYANTQLKKATSTNKKYNWDKERITRKTIIDFAKIVSKEDGKVYPLMEWLTENEYNPTQIGLVKIDGFRDGFKLYVDELKWVSDNHRFSDITETRNYKGFGEGNEPLLSEVEGYMQDQWRGVVYWNRESYSTHCREYKEYEKWKENRNEERVATNKQHGQQLDSKNILHLYRLMLTARDIVLKNTIVVNRGKEREYLLSIKRGDVDLKEVIKEAQKILEETKNLFEKSSLPEEVELNLKNLEYVLRND